VYTSEPTPIPTPTPSLSFSGHETFPFRYAWLKKGADHVAATDGTLFKRDDAMTLLGVGKNMVRSVRHWCLAARVIEEVPGRTRKPSGCFRVSAFGRAVFGERGLDPYLEDPATPWLLHWQIVTNGQRCSTWFWAFCHFHEPEFTREALTAALHAWAHAAGAKRLAASSLRRDVDCFLRTYVPARQTKVLVLEDTLDCPLVELGLICAAGDWQTFRFQRGAQPHLPDGILFYAALDFWDRTAAGRQTLSLRDLARQPGSPGQVFKIDENALAERCGRLERWTGGALSYAENTGLRQLYRHRAVDALALRRRAYEPAPGAEGRRRWRA
jgi:hypothetical protein